MPRRINRRLKRHMHWSMAQEMGAPGTDLTSTATELNLLDGSAVANSGTSVVAMLDASGNVRTAVNVGTAGTACTAVHYGNGIENTAVITITAAVMTVGSGANLGVGYLIYTLPAGNITILSAAMSVAIDDVTTTSDTPEVGLGSVIASGVVTALNGTATFEDILTGTAAADTDGAATISSVAQNMNMLTAGAHTVHFNAADGWTANADAIASVDGTVVLQYRYNFA